jgi:hypothetical protein
VAWQPFVSRICMRRWRVLRWTGVRRFLSILLLALFGLPAVAPLFSLQASAASSLPACCRKNGQHHCAMSPAERALLEGHPDAYPGLWGRGERCPYAPSTAPRVRAEALSVPVAQAVFAELASHPAVVAQTESKRRIARDRARQKRGPPAIVLS